MSMQGQSLYYPPTPNRPHLLPAKLDLQSYKLKERDLRGSLAQSLQIPDEERELWLFSLYSLSLTTSRLVPFYQRLLLLCMITVG